MFKVMVLIRGSTELKKELKNTSHETKLKWERAIRVAARYVQEKSLELTPEATGYLKSSCDMVRISSGWYANFRIFYTAEYAVFVHEMLENSHPVGEAEFLKKAVLRSEQEVLNIVRTYMAS